MLIESSVVHCTKNRVGTALLANVLASPLTVALFPVPAVHVVDWNRHGCGPRPLEVDGAFGREVRSPQVKSTLAGEKVIPFSHLPETGQLPHVPFVP